MKQIFLMLFTFFILNLLNGQDLNIFTQENMIVSEVGEIPTTQIRYNHINFIALPMIEPRIQKTFEQESRESGKFANSRINWIATEISPFGFALRYERMIDPRFSLGSAVFLNFGGDGISGMDASFRFYPWGGTFFIGCALGFYSYTTTFVDQYHYQNVAVAQTRTRTLNSLALVPEIGWKIDIGNVGGFFLQFGVALGIPFRRFTHEVEITTNGNIFQSLSFQQNYSIFAFRPLYFGIGFAF